MADPALDPAADEFDVPDDFDVPDAPAAAAVAAPPEQTPALPSAPPPPPPTPERVTINDFGRQPTVLDDLLEYGPGFVAETAQDALRGGNQGLTWLGADEGVAAAKALGGADFTQAADQERALNALAEERSPSAYQFTRAAGFIPGMVAGPIMGAGRVVQAAMPTVQGLVSGGLGSDSNDWGQTALDSLIGGAINAGAQVGLTGGGRLLDAGGKFLSKGTPAPGATAAPRPTVPPPAAAAEAAPAPAQMSLPRVGAPPEQMSLPGMARTPPVPMAEPVPAPAPVAPMRQSNWTAPGLRQWADEAAADPNVAKDVMGKAIRSAGVAAGPAATVGSMALSDQLGAASQKVAPPLLKGAAMGVDALGKTLGGTGEAMQMAGWMAPPVAAGMRNDAVNAQQPRPRIDDMAPPAPAQATASGRGNLLPQVALDVLYGGNQQALGPYASDFAQAAVSRDPNAVGALISRLTQTDPQFRQTVLPELQRRTQAGYQQPGPLR